MIVLRPIRMSELANVQPLQQKRRTSLFGRLLGSRLAGWSRSAIGASGWGLRGGASGDEPARRPRCP